MALFPGWRTVAGRRWPGLGWRAGPSVDAEVVTGRCGRGEEAARGAGRGYMAACRGAAIDRHAPGCPDISGKRGRIFWRAWATPDLTQSSAISL